MSIFLLQFLSNFELKPNDLDLKNVKEIPCFVDIVSNFFEKIIDATKSNATADDIQLYFAPQNIKTT